MSDAKKTNVNERDWNKRLGVIQELPREERIIDVGVRDPRKEGPPKRSLVAMQEYIVRNSKRQPLQVMLDNMNEAMDHAEELAAAGATREEIVVERSRAGFWAERCAQFCHVKLQIVKLSEPAQMPATVGLNITNVNERDPQAVARVYQKLMNEQGSSKNIVGVERAFDLEIDADKVEK